ncbi:PREDICTED: galactosylgalactosylxylosylprotein 3-beta-glucuronosyltransferase 2-like isoform X1 [Amphimedon queenslandica]|uniref:Galactosylgalactosylxylosylprotein 3-beta-glucuronosyltransferase n=1 Tax=Amphimedon queenslandica TaxID=400682 RepID=A0AAN0IEI1_AMPQE|nr:PREDICTED: galactosylgalactosylxylosylprotein 3-beta-glucuronosyltransferase 2-like isoform X1 [Amphimedon queenslandica]|eukprot:XP_003386393.2 PREDICTED: galactosylgalactosylxylosylprotein 3-beta-glucuronosyltransferase 2-like isoform X1 [Amphimedon queenslandica]
MEMTEGKIKWVFFLFSFSMFTFCLGWWLHTCESLCSKECFLGSPDNSFTTAQDFQFNTHDTIPAATSGATEDSSDSVSPATDPFNSTLPTIFMITPTYARATQKADLTRLCQTLMHVRNLHWIIIEDSDSETPLVTRFLKRCRVKSSQLNRKTSSKLQPPKVSAKGHKNRGAEQRNVGLDWLRENYKPGDVTGVVYFGDDDNTYDIQLFEEMRYTNKVSIWPVGLAGGLKAEGPICENGRVKKWHVGWSPGRKFPVDMAAFAVNLDIILTNSKARLNPFGPGGHLEPEFLSAITTVPELEAKADDCTKVYVWHTQTGRPSLRYEDKIPTLIETKK